MCGRGPDVQGDWIDKGKPVVRRGRKATGLAEVSQPGYRIRGKEVARTMRIKSLLSHSLQAIAEGSLIALLVVGLMAGSVFAGGKGGGGGKPGGGGSGGGGSVNLVLLDGATEAHQGGRITFTVTTSVDRPFVNVRCWQGSTGVYNASIGIFPTYMYEPWLVLDSTYWTAGVAATCTTRAYYYDRKANQVTIATGSFSVAP
jgi:hypothetical protein